MPATAEALLTPVLPPPPKRLIIEETGAPVAYACAKCGMLFIFSKNESEEERRKKHDEAAAHCMKQCVCGKRLDYHYFLRCKDCRDKLAAEREHQRFDKATKLSIEEYDDPVYWEGHSGDVGDGYFSGLDALLDHCEEEGLEVPEYVWACTRRDLRLDASDILYSALERHDLDPETYVDTAASGRLQAFLDVWVKEQNIHGWFQDASRAIVLRDDGAASVPETG